MRIAQLMVRGATSSEFSGIPRQLVGAGAAVGTKETIHDWLVSKAKNLWTFASSDLIYQPTSLKTLKFLSTFLKDNLHPSSVNSIRVLHLPA